MRANKPLTTTATPSRPTTMPTGSSTIVTPIARPTTMKHEPDDHGNHMTEKVPSQREEVPEL
jgi:hypothetical protein